MAVKGRLEKDIGSELASLDAQVGAVIDEYFDGYLLLGKRAGEEQCSMYLMKEGPLCSSHTIDDMILAHAKKIILKRQREALRR